MEKVGNYKWLQLSMWDFSPESCIETYVKSADKKHVFHYYLQRVTAVLSDSHYKVETVTSINEVPDSVLNYRNGTWQVRVNRKVTERKPINQ